MRKHISFKGISQYSVFYLIFIINLCSIIILSLFNYFVFHGNSKKAYKDSFVSYSKNVTDMAFRNLDQEIMQPIYDIPKLYFSKIGQNETILMPLEEYVLGDAKKTNDLVRELKEIQLVNPSIYSLDVYYETTETAVTGFANIHFLNSDEERDKYLPWYKEYVEQGKDSIFLCQSIHAYPQKIPVLSFINRISYSQSDKGIIVAIHIPVSMFAEYMDEKNGRLEIGALDGRLLYETSEDFNEEEGTEFFYDSPVTGLRYRYTMMNSVLYADVNVKSRVFFIDFLVSIVFNIILLFSISYYSSHIYRKKLISLSEGTGMEINIETKNFDSSLKQLKEEFQHLHDTAASSQSLRLQNAVRVLLLGRKSEDGNRILEPYLNYECCRILMIQKKEWEPEPHFLAQIQEKFWEWETQIFCHVLFTTMEMGQMATILVYPEQEEENVLREVLEKIRVGFGECRIVVGESGTMDREQVKKAYRAVCEVARYQFIFPEADLILQKEIQIEKRKESGSHLKLFESLEKDINSENLLEFEYHLEMLITSFKNGNYTINYCYSTLRDLVTLIYQIMQHRNLDMWIVYGYDIREYYKKISDIDSFQIWMKDICEVLLKNILQRRKTLDESGDLKLRLTKLIDEHLEDDISLDFLCDELSMRPDTLSRTFRQVMGEGYIEYVKKKKLSRAIELMSEDYSVKEISQHLGYNSPQYFIKIFKEAYGITPNQYKKNKL